MNYRAKRNLGAALLLVTIAQISTLGISDEKKSSPIKLVYDNLPARWDNMFVSKKTIKKYSGKYVRKLCFDDDLISEENKYSDLYVRGGQYAGRYKLFKGGQNFTVLDKHNLIIQSDHTGKHLITTQSGPCYKSLPRAKYIIFRTDSQRVGVKRCLSRSYPLNILTRYGSGFANCRIKSINEWNGPLDVWRTEQSDKDDKQTKK